MRGTLGRRTVYLGTIAAMVSLVAGFALAAITINVHNQAGQGDITNNSAGVPGVTYKFTTINLTANPAPIASSGNAGTPQHLVAGQNAFCLNACSAGDIAETVYLQFTTSFAGAMQIDVSVVATSNGGSTSVYVAQAATAVAGGILLTWDLGAGANTITSVTVVEFECSSASCP
ncbi:MAG: hypothetical protein L3K04_07875 [Thermoplasmata archaeon]|nr:hypothetical protein [Thermoplasmata archaeon]